jgi:hypothetical protein
MKSSPDISWNEKGELKYKGETVQGSNVVDLVNDVLHKIFQPTRLGNIRRGLTRSKCSTRFDWSRGPLEIHPSDSILWTALLSGLPVA